MNNYKKVILGEDCTKNLKLDNKGALPTEVIIKSAKGIDIFTKTETLS